MLSDYSDVSIFAHMVLSALNFWFTLFFPPTMGWDGNRK